MFVKKTTKPFFTCFTQNTKIRKNLQNQFYMIFVYFHINYSVWVLALGSFFYNLADLRDVRSLGSQNGLLDSNYGLVSSNSQLLGSNHVLLGAG